MRRVVDKRISRKGVWRGKPTVSSGRKAAVLGAVWRVGRTPPGSASGAGMYRGNSRTWESHLSPCFIPGVGDRATVGGGPGASGLADGVAQRGDAHPVAGGLVGE